jgi:serine-type D-Ala-D-Ala carboxypeptidase (penicillin-binding protein 5/6)
MTHSRVIFKAQIIFAILLFFFPFVAEAAAKYADDTGSRVVRKGKVAKAKLKTGYKRKFARPLHPQAILLKDLRSGRMLFEQHANDPMPPASLTKIMAAIVILENGNLEDPVTVSEQAAAAAPIKLYLRAGEVFPLRGLLEAMLIRSANDACLAAAEHLAGTEEAFVEQMNLKAKELGLTHTRFRNACGFNMPQHYSTARDLAIMTEYAMEIETFADIVKEPTAVLQTVNQTKTVIAHTTNRLLGVMDGVVGVKTGYTRAAGRCLITVIRREDKQLLLILLNARQRWATAQSMIEFGLHDPAVLTSVYQ